MQTTNIIFLVLPKVHLLDLAGADQVFYEAVDHGLNIRVSYCSYGAALETSTHIGLKEMQHFSEITASEGDYLIIPGSETGFLNSPEMAAQQDLFNWVIDCHNKKVNVCSICTGAFFLAMTGLLNNRKCTTHWRLTEPLRTKFPKINVIDNILFTEEDRIFTSAGVTSGIDLALHIIAKIKDDNASYKIARELVVYNRRSGNDAQHSIHLKYRNHIHSGVHKIQDWLQEKMDTKMVLDDLADIACMSTRNMTRVFKKETGITINDYIYILRKEKIKELLKNPDISRKDIARQCGLKSERQVGRILRN
jgi:transcriptional regulator GlxA family with amidase domain